MSKPFPFLDLPTEIRTKIYLLLCICPTPISLSHLQSSQRTYHPSSLLLTCLQIYTEIRPLFYSQNDFTISINRDNSFLHYWTLLNPAFQADRRLIQSLRIEINRWGKRNFFLDELVPAVEDMILAGGLRRLEVLVKDSYWDDGRKWLQLGQDAHDDAMDVGEGHNWFALKRILTDPDLRIARLGTFDYHEEGGPGHGVRKVIYRHLDKNLTQQYIKTST